MITAPIVATLTSRSMPTTLAVSARAALSAIGVPASAAAATMKMLRHLVRAEHLGHDEGGDDQQTGAHRYPPRPPTWCWPAPDGGSSWWDRMSGGPSPSCPMPVDQPLNCSPCLLMGSQRVVFTISVVKTSDRCTVLRTHVQARSPASATCSTRPSAGVTEPRGRQRMRQELRHGPLWRLV